MESIVLESDEALSKQLSPPLPEGDDVGASLEFGPARQPSTVSLYHDRFLWHAWAEGRQSKSAATKCAGSKAAPSVESDLWQNVAYHIGFLSSRPITVVRRNGVFLWLATFCCLAALLVMLFTKDVVPTLAILTVGLIFSGCYFRRPHRFTVFVTKHAGVPVLVISHRDASNTMIEFFTEQLSQAIRANNLPSTVRVLAEETKLLRRFRDKGFISDAHYEKGKRNIFAWYPSCRS